MRSNWSTGMEPSPSPPVSPVPELFWFWRFLIYTSGDFGETYLPLDFASEISDILAKLLGDIFGLNHGQ